MKLAIATSKTHFAAVRDITASPRTLINSCKDFEAVASNLSGKIHVVLGVNCLKKESTPEK
jgi:hypothetical protein